MSSVNLAAEERLKAAFSRYDAAWARGGEQNVVEARLALCRALLECGEELPQPVLAQMERDDAGLVLARQAGLSAVSSL